MNRYTPHRIRTIGGVRNAVRYGMGASNLVRLVVGLTPEAPITDHQVGIAMRLITSIRSKP